jgi:hypothetical protein
MFIHAFPDRRVSIPVPCLLVVYLVDVQSSRALFEVSASSQSSCHRCRHQSWSLMPPPSQSTIHWLHMCVVMLLAAAIANNKAAAHDE